MATAYPSTFPLPKIDGFSASVASGLTKTQDPSHQVQRRVFVNMPHTFSLTFVMGVTTWALWHNWVVANGYTWFTMNLPTMYAGLLSAQISPVLIRFTSNPSASTVSLSDVQITISAEIAPSAIDAFLEAT